MKASFLPFSPFFWNAPVNSTERVRFTSSCGRETTVISLSRRERTVIYLRFLETYICPSLFPPRETSGEREIVKAYFREMSFPRARGARVKRRGYFEIMTKLNKVEGWGKQWHYECNVCLARAIEPRSTVSLKAIAAMPFPAGNRYYRTAPSKINCYKNLICARVPRFSRCEGVRFEKAKEKERTITHSRQIRMASRCFPYVTYLHFRTEKETSVFSSSLVTCAAELCMQRIHTRRLEYGCSRA